MPPFEEADNQGNDAAFEDAFAQFSSPEKKQDEPPVDEGAAPPADDGAPPAADGEPPVDTPPEDAPADDEPPVDEPATEEPSVDDGTSPAADDDDILERLRNVLKEAPKEKEPPQQRQQGPVEQPPQQPALYTPEEQQILVDYKKEWPEVAKAERLMRRQEYNELVKFVFEQVSSYFQPVAETVETLAVRAQLSDINERAPDYADIRDKVVSWIDTQPAYLQAAYKTVMNEGTADEVADLLERYRQSAAPAKPAAPAGKKAEPSTTAKQAARSMAPVSTKRSSVIEGDDPNDFDAAFRKFSQGL